MTWVKSGEDEMAPAPPASLYRIGIFERESRKRGKEKREGKEGRKEGK